MGSVHLDEQFFAKIAGWDVLKQARGAVAGERVLSSAWEAPVLKGVVQEGSTTLRAGLVIKNSIDIENLCPCRASRSWGTICVHSVAVGLHHLRRKTLESSPQPTPEKTPAAALPSPSTGQGSTKRYRRLHRASGDAGQPAEVTVIFPPNFAQALSRGKLMICFEGIWKNGRSPLNALPQNVSFSFSSQDTALLDVLEDIAGDTPGMLMAGGAELKQVLRALLGHERVTIGRKQPLQIASEPARLPVKILLQGSGEILLRLALPLPKENILHAAEDTWLLGENRLEMIPLPESVRELVSGEIKISRANVPAFLSHDWVTLQTSFQVEANFTPEQFELVHVSPRVVLELSGGLANLEGKLHFDYSGQRITAGIASQFFWMPDPQVATRYGTRDVQTEQNALTRLLRAGFTGPHQNGVLQLAGQTAVLTFFARDYSKLQKEWSVTLEERLQRSTSQNIERVEPEFSITPSGQQWFDLEVAYTGSSGQKFSPAEIQRLLRSGQSHSRMPNGKFVVIDTGAVEELQEVLLDCAPTQQNGRYRIANQQSGFLSSALSQAGDWKLKAPAGWKEKANQLSGQAVLEPPPLGKLDSVLRGYQKQGVAWLKFLRENGFGGILADEMGLGKTLQTLAFLKTTIEQTPPGERRPSMIVCPTSLVFNWLAEAERFTPELRVLALHGPKRHERFPAIAEHDLVITTYSLIRRDAEMYREMEFDTVVLDEAQHIKNRQTQNAQSVKAIRCRYRFVLTGTPIENSVLDLWSIFDFLMPGYLGPAADFRERYEIPIAREKNSEAQARLARRIRPFLLRRLKKDVAKDLPEKIEQVSFCELTPEQTEVYQQLLENSRAEISKAVQQGGIQKSRMVVLTALLRLRQVCCDLRLLKLEKAGEENSGKIEMFNELLQEVLDGGHRVLVFSQFVEMLHLLRSSLEQQEIDYCYLDGSTSNRAEVVQKFQSQAIPVFLISLKAGGVGLNLSGADTVIHFDPWWNPAVEAQATDRAHRIGQTRVVTSYKLITRGTVEEKILHLQGRKKEMISATLEGEEQLTDNLTWEEIQSLFD